MVDFRSIFSPLIPNMVKVDFVTTSGTLLCFLLSNFFFATLALDLLLDVELLEKVSQKHSGKKFPTQFHND